MLEDPPGPSPEDVAKQRMLRVAWTVVAGGALVAFGAAVIGGSSPDTNVDPARQLAGMIMLTGLLVVLVAHRIAWLRRLRQRLDMSPPIRGNRETHSMRRFLLLGLPMIIGAIIVVSVALLFVPSLLAGLVIMAMAFLIPVVLLVVAVYGKGYAATFCLGALVPTLAQLLGFITSFGMLPFAWGFSAVEIVQFVGDAAWSTGLVWLAAVIAGLVAIGTRALVTRNQSPEGER